VVVDPAARSVTHLIVTPPQRDGTRRLVPVRLATSETAAIQLRCTLLSSKDSGRPTRRKPCRGPLVSCPTGRTTSCLRPTTGEGGKHRVAIPISAVADFSDIVQLNLTKNEVRDLPSADPAPDED
jgi:hypothetical protein